MPTYDYVCENCGHSFEKFQMISASPLRKCPECAKMKLKRLIGTGAGIIFKGGGFYETDYRSESYKQGQQSENKPQSDSSTAAKGETKPEGPKKETKKESKAPKSADKSKQTA
jgi:putative FmdB family regulatory protein